MGHERESPTLPWTPRFFNESAIASEESPRDAKNSEIFFFSISNPFSKVPATAEKSCGALGTNPLASAFDDNKIISLSWRSEEHTSELQSRENLVCRLLLEKKNTQSDQLD